MYSIDEHTLAAFLDGTLTPARRQEVIAYLAQSAEARELLKMSCEAMAAAEEAALLEQVEAAEQAEASLPYQPSPSERPPRRSPLASVPRWASYAVALVTAAVLSLLYFAAPSEPEAEPPTLLRSVPDEANAEENIELHVQVSTPALRFRWNAVPDAYEYRLVVFNHEGRMVARHTTKETHLDSDDAFISELRSKLEPERQYSLRIDAVDVRYRDIVSSAGDTYFTLERD